MAPCRLGVLLGVLVLLAGVAAAQLPPAMQVDLSLVEAERHIETGDYAAAKAALDRILELQAAHEVALPEAFWFKHAQVARQAGLYADAVESVTRYLTTAGREGAHYRAALELLDRVRLEEAAAERRRAAAARRAEEIGDVLTAMEFVRIEPGIFEMGSPETEEGRGRNEILHRVTISQPFSLGKYEVTQGQWEAVMGNNPSHFSACGPTCPVEQVSWEDTQAFITELNRWGDGATYRLPTEAEWEYAARAGTQTAYHFGEAASQLGAYAWYYNNADFQTHPVGQKRPNGWGLYDMLGNVVEWTADWYGERPSGVVTDPRGPSTGVHRVSRGGGWNSRAHRSRSAERSGGSPGNYGFNVGFRLARDP